MGDIMVDSNVLLDVLTEDPVWFEWSSRMLAGHAETVILVINPVIYAEISVNFAHVREVDAVLSDTHLQYRHIPPLAAFLAGKAFNAYRQKGGTKLSTLPDFFIGAHAAVEGMKLLTRDAGRYRTYFPRLALICP